MRKIQKPAKILFKNKKVLITIGPTQEYLDPVRFLSNASSGKMGLTIAKKLRSYGADLFLICGPGISPPKKFRFCSVTSAQEMLKEVQKMFLQSDFFISSAAVSDYRPKKITQKKIHKNRNSWSLSLTRNPDILATVTKKKTKQFCVGFALEDSNGLKRAVKKMKEKRCDLIVLNSPDSIGSDHIHATIIFWDGTIWSLGQTSKKKFSEKLCQAIVHSLTKSHLLNAPPHQPTLKPKTRNQETGN